MLILSYCDILLVAGAGLEPATSCKLNTQASLLLYPAGRAKVRRLLLYNAFAI
nr:MAG TPA: hypothetical protein [Caudoviricetes sp.]